jgi:hypothetical protein
MRFFCLLLPAALLGFAVISEVLAYELRGIQPFRTSLDAIASAAEQEPANARWLVFGDSLTQHVLLDYALGPPDFVANLTTHAGAGVPSMYLLLQRYLARHPPPKGIVLVLSPEVYADIPSQREGAFWLTSTFLKPDEQAWLSQFYSSAHIHGWLPAAADLKASVLDPLTGLFAPKVSRLVIGPKQPLPDVPVESPLPSSPSSIASEKQRAAHRLELGSTRPVLVDICRVARRYGFEVHLVMAPMPIPLRKAFEDRGDLARFNAQVSELMTRECGDFVQYDLSTVVQPPNFDNDGTHIVGSGWQNRFALALKDYIRHADEQTRQDEKQ